MRYYSARVHDNEDPDQLGRLMLEIPALLGEDGIHPDWIAPRVTPGAGPNAAGLIWLPPVDALVVVEAVAEGPSPELRWLGSELGNVNTLPAFLAGNYPRRAGWTSPTGSGTFALDDDTGAFVVVDQVDDPEGLQHFLHLARSGAFQVGVGTGGSLLLDPAGFVIVTPAGHLLQLDDSTPQIAIVHKDGVELITLGGGVTKINGTAIQLAGGTIELGDGLVPPLDAYLKPTAQFPDFVAFLTALEAFMTTVSAAVVEPTLAPAAIAFLAAQPPGVFSGKFTASLAAGPPYLSTLIKGT